MSIDLAVFVLGVIAATFGAYFKFAKGKIENTQVTQDKSFAFIQNQLNDLKKADEEKTNKIDELKNTILDMKAEALKKDIENSNQMSELQRKLDVALDLLRKNDIELSGVLTAGK